ncbi:hypothetical protein CRG98_006753 [Punica granatum]|uniref:Uncharacterized protein n=1 Tax=Punica granatum TaxID=22663 RepID=A0A2I0KWM7_PUNGR|nr:hypothetical protein CRG98_006753 [Punica granatum]
MVIPSPERRDGTFKSRVGSLVYGPECGLSSGPTLRAFGSRGLGVATFPWGHVTDTLKSDLPSLGIRGKSRGSVRESGDSVERLEGCSGAKDARLGVHGRRARGQARRGVCRRAARCASTQERAATGALFT